MPRISRLAAVALLAFLFATNVYRAVTQSIAHDEAMTYNLFVNVPWEQVFNSYGSNHHVLHSILCKVSVGLFGLSEFTLRIPSLLSGLLYFWVVFKLSEKLFGASWQLLVAVSALSLNPYMLDFLSAARGYGMAVAFFLFAVYQLVEWFESRRADALLKAGCGFGLSIAANLTLSFPISGLIAAFLITWWKTPQLPEPPKKKKREKSLNLGAAQVSWRLILPLAISGWLLFLYPLSNASVGQFNAGVRSGTGALQGLVRSSFFYSLSAPAPVVWAASFVLVPALILAAAVFAAFALRERFIAGENERLLALIGGTILLTLCLLFAGHYILGLNLPNGRTGVYWIPLLTLECLLMARANPKFTTASLAALGLCALAFAAQFNFRSYLDWRGDANTRAITRRIMDDHAARPRDQVRVGGSWQFEPSLNFYREMYQLKWMQPVLRKAPGPQDYYVFLPQDQQEAETLGLTVIYRDRAGAIVGVGKS